MSSQMGNDRTLLGVAMAMLGALALALVDAWLAAGIATATTGPGWHPPPAAPDILVRLAVADGVAGLAPGAAAVAFWIPFIVLATIEGVGCVWLGVWAYQRWGTYKDPSKLAGRSDLGDLAGKAAAEKARGLRPSLERQRDLGRELGIRLLRVGGRDAWMSWEDVALVIMGPRSNKTSAIVVPSLLSCPGPVVATSNKSDVWALTRELRNEIGPVWTFDPQHIAHAPQTWFWDPLRGIRATPQDERVQEASRLGSHFMATIAGSQADPFFHQAAERVLCSSILAAVAHPEATMREVLAWLRSARARDAIAVLDAHGAEQDAAELEETLDGADVTSKGIFETARTAVSCLRSEALLRWLTPPHTWRRPPHAGQEIEEIDPWQLLVPGTRPETLYLLSKEGGSSAAPVITAFIDRIGQVAELGAQARGGRLDPSLLLVMDEAANICPLKSLPAQYSHWGSRGIQAITILQSYRQGVRVWERDGMDALWSASTVKFVGAGVDDAEFLGHLAQLVGDRWAPQPMSVSKDRSGGASEQFSMTKEPILPVSALRALPKTEALLITPGRPIGHGRLLPWYSEDLFDGLAASDITAANQRASAEIRTAAVDYLGPANPLAQALAAEQAGTP